MTDGHARGCAGRKYTCTCGYDDRRDVLVERLKAELARISQERDDAVLGLHQLRNFGNQQWESVQRRLVSNAQAEMDIEAALAGWSPAQPPGDGQ